ncbi:hypothetical protein PCASD_24562 [Puccinia coronata f. sp. avenae]|uniref:CCHC-type domain-containing protein n=1 Tax=Puccinia coronata f. sp. avenae TaxID=200324 RepID=A0A2N5SQK1_9BASI|nr:hypothetical protein PCASD_24562 [Puccinia coronata f. sp. avenae]
MVNLKERFVSVCRSAQISTFMKLLRVEPDSFATTAAYAVEMRDIISDLKALDVDITADHLMGFLLQINLKDGPVKQELNQKVEATMYANQLHKTPTFDELLRMLNTESPSEVAANAARNSNCHICRQHGHWAADCPIGKKPPPQKPISWQQRNPTAFPNGYSPYCPIVVAPNFLPYGSPYPIPNFTQPHQIPTPPNKQLSPTPPTNPQGRPYESYKPSYPRQRPDVTTKNVEVGNIKDEIAELQLHGKVTADAVSAQPEIITDTGVGTMSFPGKNGMTVSVKGMMYCEQASSTLISPAALRRANVRIAYDSTAQTIVLDGYICGYVGRFEPMLHWRDISSVWLDATLALVDTTPFLLDANTLLVDIVLVIVDAIPAILDAILVRGSDAI